MKITIIALLLFVLALPVHGAILTPHVPPYNDTLVFVPVERVAREIEKPLTVKKLEVATTTVMSLEEQRLIELRRLIAELQALIEVLKARQG